MQMQTIEITSNFLKPTVIFLQQYIKQTRNLNFCYVCICLLKGVTNITIFHKGAIYLKFILILNGILNLDTSLYKLLESCPIVLQKKKKKSITCNINFCNNVYVLFSTYAKKFNSFIRIFNYFERKFCSIVTNKFYIYYFS